MPRKGEYEKWIKGEGLKKIIEWVKSGLDDKQIAEDKIHIHKSTLYDWFNRFPEFADTYKKAKEIPEAAVENALYNTAIGRTYYEEVRIIKIRMEKQYEPYIQKEKYHQTQPRPCVG